MIYKHKVVVYVVGVSDEKLQQKKIDELKKLFSEFKEDINKKIT